MEIPKFILSLGLLTGITLSTGCQSRSPAQYVSPRVIGRVVDHETGAAVKGVEVRRVVPDYDAGTLEPARGGTALQKLQTLHTAADGSFELPSQKSVALFRDIGWFSIELSFIHRGYEKFLTNYTARAATLSPGGEPVIQAGEIRLRRKSD